MAESIAIFGVVMLALIVGCIVGWYLRGDFNDERRGGVSR